MLSDQQTIISLYEKWRPEREDDLLQAALAYAYCGQTDKAVSLIQKMLEKNPKDAAALQLLGLVQLGSGNTAEAANTFAKSWDLGTPDALRWLAYSYLMLEKRTEFSLLIPKMLERKGTVPQLGDLLVLYAWSEKPPDTNLFLKAVRDLSDEFVLERQGRFLQAYIVEFWDAGQENRARQLIAKAQRTNTDSADMLLDSPYQQDRIIQNYEKDRDAWKQDELFLAAIAYGSQRQFDKAKELYSKYLEVSPNDRRAMRGLGMISMIQGNVAEAEPQLTKAWKLGDVPSLKCLTLIYDAGNRHDELGRLVPDLLKNKNKDIELAIYVLDYALSSNPPDHKLYDKAVDGINNEMILGSERPETIKMFIERFEKGGQHGRAEAIEKAAELKMIDLN